MKIYWLSLFAGAVIIFSFQNCQKSPYLDEINTIAKGTTSVSGSSSINLDQQRLSQVSFLSKQQQVLVKNQTSFTVIVNQEQQIDLQTGKITVTTDLNSSPSFYCLTDELKNELISILKSSSVCKSNSALPAGQVCSQIIKQPYAVIVTDVDKYDLGSATDGCGSNAVDLCNDQPSLLKGFIANLNNKISTLVCK